MTAVAQRETGVAPLPWSGQMSCRLVYPERTGREALRQYFRYVLAGPLAVQFVLASLAIVVFYWLDMWNQPGRTGKVAFVCLNLYWCLAGIWLIRSILRERNFAKSLVEMPSSTQLTLQPKRHRLYLKADGDEHGRYIDWNSVDRVAVTRDYCFILTDGRVRAFFPRDQLPDGMMEYLLQKQRGFWQQPAIESYRQP